RRPRPHPRPSLFPYTTLFRSQGTGAKPCSWSRVILLHPTGRTRTLGMTQEPSIGSIPVISKCLDLIGEPNTAYGAAGPGWGVRVDRKSTRLNSSHVKISYAVF